MTSISNILFMLFILASQSVWAQITSWSAAYTGATVQPCPYAQSNFTLPVVSSLTFSQVTRGSGIACASIASGINSESWTEINGVDAIAAADYYELSINSFCPAYDLDSIRYSMVSSLDGPTRAFAMVSINGGGFLPFGTEFTISNLGSSFSYTITGTSVQVPQGGNLRIRFYAHSAISATGTHAFTNNTILFLKTIEPSASMSGTESICSGQSVNLSIHFTGTGPWDIIWSDGFNNSSINGINTNPYILTLFPTVTRTYSVVSVVSLCSGQVSGNTVVNVTPSIGNNIISPSQTVCVGNPTTLITGTTPVGGTGTHTYQWQLSLDQLSWTPLSGAVNPSFNAGLASMTFYFRRVVSAGTCPPSTSNEVALVVLPEFNNNTISSNQTVCIGNPTAQFNGSIPTGGTGTYGYQWESSLNNTTWGTLAGAVNQHYTHPLITSNIYFRRISTTGACTPIASNTVTVTTEPGIGNNIIGSSQAICVGNMATPLTGTVPTGGTGSYTYQWESSTDNITYYEATPGNGLGYSPGMILTNTYFRRVVSSGPCAGATSLSVFVRPDNPVTGNIIGNAQTLCTGNPATMLTGTTPTGGFGGYGYQWQTSTDDIAWTNITGAVNNTHNPGVLVSTLYFRRIISSGACNPNTSASIQLLIQSQISSNTVISNQTLCTGTLASVLTGSGPAGGDGFYAYSWQSSPDGFVWNTAAGENNINLNPFFPAQTVRYRRIVNSGVCPPSTSTAVILTVHQWIDNNFINPDQTLCAGNIPDLLTGTVPTGGVGSYAYQWISSNDNMNWTSISGANTMFHQPGVIQFTTYYSRVVSSGVCAPDTAFSIIADVYQVPGPNLIGNTQTLCGNPLPDLITGSLPVGGSGGISYEWLFTSDSVNWLPYPDGTLQDLTVAPVNSSFWLARVLSSGTCDNDTSAYIELIYQDGPGNNIISGDQTICAGLLPGFMTGSTPSGGSGLYMYQWESSQDSIQWNPVPSGTLRDYQPPIDANDIWYRRIVSAGSTCTPDSGVEVKITVLDPPSAVLSGSQSICESYSAELSIHFSGGSPPWNVSYLDGTSIVSLTGITDSLYTFSVTPSVHTTYKLLSVNDICPGFYSGEPVVIVYLRPWAVLSNDQTVCTPGQAEISITMYGQGPWDLSYTDGAGIVSINGITSNPYVLTVYPMGTTSYRLTELFDGRCYRSDHSNVSVVTGYSALPPVVSFSYLRNANTVWFTNTSINADTYKWDFGDGDFSTLKNPYHYYFFNGNYQVKLVGYNVCGSDSIFQVVTSVGTDDAVFGTIPEVYPNPLQDYLYFKLSEGDIAQKVTVFNPEGKIMYEAYPESEFGREVYNLDLRSLSPGVYMLQVETDKGRLMGRVIKQ